jgi:hypothetical protein
LQRHLERLQRKLGRKALFTNEGLATSRTVADNPLAQLEEEADEEGREEGSATLMSRLMRKELKRMNQGNIVSQWLNKPWVLAPLFVLVVSIIVWGFTRNRHPDAEQLFADGSKLMESDDPADWKRAWDEHLALLQKHYPDNPHREEVEQFRQLIDDRAAQQQALLQLRFRGVPSEGQRFYQRGLQLCKQGDVDGARLVWQNLVRSFAGVESEQRWVALSRDALAELQKRVPTARRDDAPVRAALARARQLKKAGKPKEAEEIWSGLEALYADDPAGAALLKEMGRDRGL